MGKTKKSMSKPQQASHKKFKKQVQYTKFNKQEEHNDQIQDVMAWGRSKQNYYRQDQQEYSSLSEQQQQAKKIYQNQYNKYLNDEDLYQIPTNQKIKEPIKKSEHQKNPQFLQPQQQDQQQKLPAQYIKQQLQWVLELFKDLEYYQENDLLKIYEKLLKSYLATIISIKQFEIAYIQYHPIITLAVDIKTKITHLMKKLTVKDENEDQIEVEHSLNDDQKNSDEAMQIDDDLDQEQDKEGLSNREQFGQQEEFSQENGFKDYPDHCNNATKVQNDEHRKGLEFYNQIKKSQQQQKKQKKLQRKLQHQANKKPTFRQLKQNEGRFASELILKNKGLIKKRKKIEGNSRVKLRKKFEKKKAIHRAKTGHFIRENPGRAYQGQANIKTGKLAGVRLK